MTMLWYRTVRACFTKRALTYIMLCTKMKTKAENSATMPYTSGIVI